MKRYKYIVVIFLLIISSCRKEDSLGDSKESMALKNQRYFDVSVDGSITTIADIAETPYKTPGSPYGQTAILDFRVNQDASIDVLWISNGDRNISRISLGDESLIEELAIPAVANSGGEFLGFEKLGQDKFVIGYSRDNAFGNVNAEAWYTAFDKSGVLFSTRIFGEKDASLEGSKGWPGAAGCSTLRYNPNEGVVAIYLPHQQTWDSGLHQAGWMGFLDADTGELIRNSKGDHIGSGWFYSHNFDQRCIVSSDNKFYTLAHGDHYPRLLGLNRWSSVNGDEYHLPYYHIENGMPGDNSTLASTGDFVETVDNRVAIVYSTSDGRKQRDLRLALVSGMAEATENIPAVIEKELWITNLDKEFVGWGSKIANYGDNLFIGWNTYVDGTPMGSSFVIVDKNGKKITEVYRQEQACFHPSQSVYPSADGKYLIWISAPDSNTIRVHMLELV